MLFSQIDEETDLIINLINSNASDESEKVQPIDVLYTDCYVKLVGSEEYERFTDEYKNFVLDGSESLENLGNKQTAALKKLIIEAESIKIGDISVGDILADMGLTEESVQWFVLDRANANVSYISFDMNVEKVEEIAGIFPVFFIVVAALVALTSMTRMVEEDRHADRHLQGARLRAGPHHVEVPHLLLPREHHRLRGGYPHRVQPAAFHLLAGVRLAVHAAELILAFSPWFALIVFAVALVGTALVTWATCRTSLKEKPSQLMQPKAPKPGKRIWLERVGFIWNHLKFKWKATIRNIFRYKKNMILTIISVMGCTALILTGFGLNDSVVAVTDIQYGEVFLYDTVIEYTHAATSPAAVGKCAENLFGKRGRGEQHRSVHRKRHPRFRRKQERRPRERRPVRRARRHRRAISFLYRLA